MIGKLFYRVNTCIVDVGCLSLAVGECRSRRVTSIDANDSVSDSPHSILLDRLPRRFPSVFLLSFVPHSFSLGLPPLSALGEVVRRREK